MIAKPTLQSIPEQVAGRLRGELLAGQFKVGEPLREMHLAERFGVGRGAIRQVLQQLAREGLVIAKRNCGVVVAPPPPDSVHELIRPMRAMMETYALRLCLKDLDEDDFREWGKILDGLRLACERADYQDMRDWDFLFHRWLLERAGLRDLVEIWTMVTTRQRPLCEAGDRMLPDPRFVHGVHCDLLDVFRNADVDEACRVLAEHIEDGAFNEAARQRWRKRSRKSNRD
jgi:DNA-binding GntR family transcriptional regulator